VSEHTKCNYCTLKALKRRFGVGNVKLLPARDSELGGLDVYVRSDMDAAWPEKSNIWFMQLTAHCVC
jgi:hypothetical protein